MTQTLIAYLVTAAAAGWVVWSMLLPRAAKRAIRAPFARLRPAAGSKSGCDCDGSCG